MQSRRGYCLFFGLLLVFCHAQTGHSAEVADTPCGDAAYTEAPDCDSALALASSADVTPIDAETPCADEVFDAAQGGDTTTVMTSSLIRSDPENSPQDVDVKNTMTDSVNPNDSENDQVVTRTSAPRVTTTTNSPRSQEDDSASASVTVTSSSASAETVNLKAEDEEGNASNARSPEATEQTDLKASGTLSTFYIVGAVLGTCLLIGAVVAALRARTRSEEEEWVSPDSPVYYEHTRTFAI